MPTIAASDGDDRKNGACAYWFPVKVSARRHAFHRGLRWSLWNFARL